MKRLLPVLLALALTACSYHTPGPKNYYLMVDCRMGCQAGIGYFNGSLITKSWNLYWDNGLKYVYAEAVCSGSPC